MVVPAMISRMREIDASFVAVKPLQGTGKKPLHKQGTRSWMHRLKTIFDDIDRDRSGVIDPE